MCRDFPGGLVTEILGSWFWWPEFNPWSGSYIHVPQLKILHATTKTWLSQIDTYVHRLDVNKKSHRKADTICQS